MEPLRNKTIDLPELATKSKPGSFNRDGKLYYDLWQNLRQEWWETARTYEANPGSFFNAWWYLNSHPAYWRLRKWASSDEDLPLRHMRHLDSGNAFTDGSIWMSVQRVNPADGKISDDSALNTRLEVWLETGEWSWSVDEKHHIGLESHFHNYKIDCGGETYEAAVIAMARNVWRFYGNDRRKCAPEYEERRQKKRDRRKSMRDMKVSWETPYGHPCRYQGRPGLEGVMERAAFEDAMRRRDREMPHEHEEAPGAED